MRFELVIDLPAEAGSSSEPFPAERRRKTPDTSHRGEAAARSSSPCRPSSPSPSGGGSIHQARRREGSAPRRDGDASPLQWPFFSHLVNPPPVPVFFSFHVAAHLLQSRSAALASSPAPAPFSSLLFADGESPRGHAAASSRPPPSVPSSQACASSSTAASLPPSFSASAPLLSPLSPSASAQPSASAPWSRAASHEQGEASQSVFVLPSCFVAAESRAAASPSPGASRPSCLVCILGIPLSLPCASFLSALEAYYPALASIHIFSSASLQRRASAVPPVARLRSCAPYLRSRSSADASTSPATAGERRAPPGGLYLLQGCCADRSYENARVGRRRAQAVASEALETAEAEERRGAATEIPEGDGKGAETQQSLEREGNRETVTVAGTGERECWCRGTRLEWLPAAPAAWMREIEASEGDGMHATSARGRMMERGETLETPSESALEARVRSHEEGVGFYGAVLVFKHSCDATRFSNAFHGLCFRHELPACALRRKSLSFISSLASSPTSFHDASAPPPSSSASPAASSASSVSGVPLRAETGGWKSQAATERERRNEKRLTKRKTWKKRLPDAAAANASASPSSASSSSASPSSASSSSASPSSASSSSASPSSASSSSASLDRECTPSSEPPLVASNFASHGRLPFHAASAAACVQENVARENENDKCDVAGESEGGACVWSSARCYVIPLSSLHYRSVFRDAAPADAQGEAASKREETEGGASGGEPDAASVSQKATESARGQEKGLHALRRSLTDGDLLGGLSCLPLAKSGPAAPPSRASGAAKAAPAAFWEIPACPACLERVDETATGIATQPSGWKVETPLLSLLAVAAEARRRRRAQRRDSRRNQEWRKIKKFGREAEEDRAEDRAAGGTEEEAAQQRGESRGTRQTANINCCPCASSSPPRASLRGPLSSLSGAGTASLSPSHSSCVSLGNPGGDCGAEGVLESLFPRFLPIAAAETAAIASCRVCFAFLLAHYEAALAMARRERKKEKREANAGGGAPAEDSEEDTQRERGRGLVRCGSCAEENDLWLCLVCGHCGCGRYRLGHAKAHSALTFHRFCLHLPSGRIWDYRGDVFVHRLLLPLSSASSLASLVLAPLPAAQVLPPESSPEEDEPAPPGARGLLASSRASLPPAAASFQPTASPSSPSAAASARVSLFYTLSASWSCDCPPPAEAGERARPAPGARLRCEAYRASISSISSPPLAHATGGAARSPQSSAAASGGDRDAHRALARDGGLLAEPEGEGVEAGETAEDEGDGGEGERADVGAWRGGSRGEREPQHRTSPGVDQHGEAFLPRRPSSVYSAPCGFRVSEGSGAAAVASRRWLSGSGEREQGRQTAERRTSREGEDGREEWLPPAQAPRGEGAAREREESLAAIGAAAFRLLQGGGREAPREEAVPQDVRRAPAGRVHRLSAAGEGTAAGEGSCSEARRAREDNETRVCPPLSPSFRHHAEREVWRALPIGAPAGSLDCLAAERQGEGGELERGEEGEGATARRDLSVFASLHEVRSSDAAHDAGVVSRASSLSHCLAKRGGERAAAASYPVSSSSWPCATRYESLSAEARRASELVSPFVCPPASSSTSSAWGGLEAEGALRASRSLASCASVSLAASAPRSLPTRAGCAAQEPAPARGLPPWFVFSPSSLASDVQYASVSVSSPSGGTSPPGSNAPDPSSAPSAESRSPRASSAFSPASSFATLYSPRPASEATSGNSVGGSPLVRPREASFPSSLFSALSVPPLACVRSVEDSTSSLPSSPPSALPPFLSVSSPQASELALPQPSSPHGYPPPGTAPPLVGRPLSSSHGASLGTRESDGVASCRSPMPRSDGPCACSASFSPLRHAACRLSSRASFPPPLSPSSLPRALPPSPFAPAPLARGSLASPSLVFGSRPPVPPSPLQFSPPSVGSLDRGAGGPARGDPAFSSLASSSYCYYSLPFHSLPQDSRVPSASSLRARYLRALVPPPVSSWRKAEMQQHFFFPACEGGKPATNAACGGARLSAAFEGEEGGEEEADAECALHSEGAEEEAEVNHAPRRDAPDEGGVVPGWRRQGQSEAGGDRERLLLRGSPQAPWAAERVSEPQRAESPPAFAVASLSHAPRASPAPASLLLRDEGERRAAEEEASSGDDRMREQGLAGCEGRVSGPRQAATWTAASAESAKEAPRGESPEDGLSRFLSHSPFPSLPTGLFGEDEGGILVVPSLSLSPREAATGDEESVENSPAGCLSFSATGHPPLPLSSSSLLFSPFATPPALSLFSGLSPGGEEDAARGDLGAGATPDALSRLAGMASNGAGGCGWPVRERRDGDAHADVEPRLNLFVLREREEEEHALWEEQLNSVLSSQLAYQREIYEFRIRNHENAFIGEIEVATATTESLNEQGVSLQVQLADLACQRREVLKRMKISQQRVRQLREHNHFLRQLVDSMRHASKPKGSPLSISSPSSSGASSSRPPSSCPASSSSPPPSSSVTSSCSAAPSSGSFASSHSASPSPPRPAELSLSYASAPRPEDPSGPFSRSTGSVEPKGPASPVSAEETVPSEPSVDGPASLSRASDRRPRVSPRKYCIPPLVKGQLHPASAEESPPRTQAGLSAPETPPSASGPGAERLEGQQALVAEADSKEVHNKKGRERRSSQAKKGKKKEVLHPGHSEGLPELLNDTGAERDKVVSREQRPSAEAAAGCAASSAGKRKAEKKDAARLAALDATVNTLQAELARLYELLSQGGSPS